MKQSAENVSIDALQLPPSGTLEIFGYRIPVTDFVTVGEAVELEKLVDRTDLSAIEMNLEAVAVFIRHRLDEPVEPGDLQKQPIPDIAAFEEGVNILLRPFASAYAHARAKRAQTLREGIANAIKLIGDASKAN